MKQSFTLIAAVLLAGNVATAQQANPFSPKAKKTEQAKASGLIAPTNPMPLKLKDNKSQILKSASAIEYPESITNYNWSGSITDWAQTSIETFDGQGRLVTRTFPIYRNVYTYNNPQWSWIETSESRANEASPWGIKNIARHYLSPDNKTYISENLVNDGSGNMVLQWGMKSIETTTTIGNVTIEESLHYEFQLGPADYVIFDGDKNETERNSSGKIVRESDYRHNGIAFVLKDESTYTYDGNGRLTQILESEYNDPENDIFQKYELIYGSGNQPDLAFYYKSNSSDDISFMGRYKNMVWINWEESMAQLDIEPAAYLAQKAIDPLGDKYSDANYTNMEKREQNPIGYYNYSWLNDTWFLVGQETIETNGEGVTTEIDFWIDMDEQSGQPSHGNKNEITSDNNNVTSIVSMYNADEQTWIPYSKTVESLSPSNSGNEETEYMWLDVNDDQTFEWVISSYEKNLYTSNSYEKRSASYNADGSTQNSHFYYYELDSYDNTTKTKLQNTERQFNSETMEFETNTYTEERLFAYTYSEGRLMQSIETVRYSETGEYANKEKKVYHYKAPTAIETIEIGNIIVFPTVANQTITIKTAETGVATMTNTSGKIVKTISLKAGSNIIQTNDLPKGMYIITVKCQSATTTVKVVKQ